MPGRNVALSIAVFRPANFLHLEAALNAATEFHRWAAAAGYKAELLTDKMNPVTVNVLKERLDVLLAGSPIDRFVLFFAGHGLIRQAGEGLWLMSDTYTTLKAVAVEVLKRRLCDYPIQQIAIFSDACRSLPDTIQLMDLAADGVLDRGPSPNNYPELEKFVAAQDGKEAYAVPGSDPQDDRCFFSGVLLEALWGMQGAAFSTARPTMVIGTSLAKFLRFEVPAVAKRYKRTLNPQIDLGFSEGTDVYLEQGRLGSAPPAFPVWPDPKKVLSTEALESKPRGSPSDFGPDEHQNANDLLKRIQEMRVPDSFETGSGFAVEGPPLAAVWTTHEIHPVPVQPTWWQLEDSRTPDRRVTGSQPVFFEFGPGRFAAATALPGFIGSIVCGERGVSALIYRQILLGDDGSHRFTGPYRSEQAIATMEAAGLRANEKIDLATSLRFGKHSDPVLGVISAYLYDSIGDIDSIRSMAYFYIQNQQPIPFDIAMLARLRGTYKDGVLQVDVPIVRERKPRTESENEHAWTWGASPAANGPVGGLWPWMRQGWDYLDSPAEDGSTLTLPAVFEVRSHLQRSRFATLDEAGARALAERLKMLRTAARPPLAVWSSLPRVAAMRQENAMFNLEDARKFVDAVDLKDTPRGLVAQTATNDATIALDKAKNQAQVVGSTLFSFEAGVDVDVRGAISDSALLAQLVANKRTSAEEDPLKWFAEYSVVLQNTGWVLQDHQFTDYSADGQAVEVHEKIVELMAVVLGPAPAAAAIVGAAVTALKGMNPNSPWITIFSREAVKAKIARFQVGFVEQDPTGATFVTLLACLMTASSTITQVLFFKYRSANARFQARSEKVSINREALVALRVNIQNRVRAYQQDYLSKVLDI